jgi:CBS domain-containing protein
MALVHHLLEDARKRLAVIGREALLCEAAHILANPNTPLVIVCDDEGAAVGVLSKSDVIRALAVAKADAARLSAGAVMTNPILSCRAEETLQRVWDAMNSRSLQSVPVLDASGRPQGIVHARDLARALLSEVDEEEGLLRDYVLGIGYQ